jgi:hypothetical protein
MLTQVLEQDWPVFQRHHQRQHDRRSVRDEMRMLVVVPGGDQRRKQQYWYDLMSFQQQRGLQWEKVGLHQPVYVSTADLQHLLQLLEYMSIYESVLGKIFVKMMYSDDWKQGASCGSYDDDDHYWRLWLWLC